MSSCFWNWLSTLMTCSAAYAQKLSHATRQCRGETAVLTLFLTRALRTTFLQRKDTSQPQKHVVRSAATTRRLVANVPPAPSLLWRTRFDSPFGVCRAR